MTLAEDYLTIVAKGLPSGPARPRKWWQRFLHLYYHHPSVKRSFQELIRAYIHSTYSSRCLAILTSERASWVPLRRRADHVNLTFFVKLFNYILAIPLQTPCSRGHSCHWLSFFTDKLSSWHDANPSQKSKWNGFVWRHARSLLKKEMSRWWMHL